MKKTQIVGIVAVFLAAAFAVLAAEKNTAGQALVRLKVDGKTVAELRVFNTSKLSLAGDQMKLQSETTGAKGATLQFGGPSGKSITVKSEEMEISPLNE